MFQIHKITSVLHKISPIIIIEPVTIPKRKYSKMIPVEATKLWKINSVFCFKKT